MSDRLRLSCFDRLLWVYHGIDHMYAEWFEENVFKLALHESVLDGRERAAYTIRSRCPEVTSTEHDADPAAGLAKGVEVNHKNYLDRFPLLALAHQV